jgi:ribosomal 50S subunit-associated protein YjgA (DUF615 family)
LFNSVTPDTNNTEANLALLAQAAQAVIDTATNGTTGTPTLAQLTALGITDVNATNLSAVQQAIRSASAADVSPLTDLQTLITGAIADLTAITAGTGAEVNFTDINITDVNSSNIGAINSAINDANTSASTKEEVQTIVDSYNVLLALANGLDDNGTNASQTDFENIGISEVNTTQEVSLLSSIIDEKSSTDVNTTTKISALAQIVDKIMNAAAGNTPTPTASDLANIGIQGVTADNLDSYLALLAATAADGSGVDTLDKLRVLATNDVPTVSTTATGNGFIVNGDGVSVFKDTNISTVEISQRIVSIELNATNITDTNETLEVNGTVVNMNVAQVTTALNTIGDYNVTIDGNNSTIVLSDLNLTQTQANSLIDTIKYKNTDSTPTKGDRVITLAKVQDNGGTAYSGVDTWSTSVSSTINVDNISFVISGSANEGSESGQTLNISNLIGATFDSSSDYNSSTVVLGNIPTGVTYSVARDNDENLTITLSGNRLVDYDSDISLDVNISNTLLDGSSVDAIKSSNVVFVANTALDGMELIKYLSDNNLSTDTNASVEDYIAAGISGATAGNLASYNSMLNTDINISDVNQTKDMVNTYNALIGFANGTDNNDSNLTLSQVDELGLSDINSTDELALFNDIVDNASNSNIDSAEELAAIEAAIQALTNTTNGTAPKITKAQLELLGITGVTDDNLAVILVKIEASSEADVNDLTKLQTAVTTAATALTTVRANTATTTHFSDIGITGVNAANIDAINSAIANVDTSTATKEDIQSIVDAYLKINILADSTDNNGTKLTKLEFESLGITDMNTTSELSLIGDVLDTKSNNDVNTTTKIAALTSSVQNVMNSVNGTTPDVNVSQLSSLGMNDVNSSNLSTILYVLSQTSGESDVNTTSKLQSLINTANTNLTAALSGIGNTANFNNIGITGVDATNIGAINNAIANKTPKPTTKEEIQAIVDAYNNVLSGVSDDNATTVAPFTPSTANYGALGITDVNDTNIAALNSFLNTSDINTSDVNTTSKLQTVVDAVNALANADTNLTATNLEALGLDDDMNTSNTEQMKLLNNILPDGNNSAANVENIAKAVKAMFDTPITTTVDNFNDLGISDVNSSNLASINELIENTTPRPTTKEEIQAIVNALNKLRTAPTSNPSLTKDDLEKLNISDMNTTDELKLINSVLTNISNEDTNTTAKLQAIANAVQNVMNSSNGTTPDVNATQLATLGITDVNVTNIAGIVDALKNANPKPTTKEEIQTLVNNYNAVQALANGGNTDVNTTQLANLGINSATSANEAIYNSFLSSTDINTSDVNTTSKLQTVVDAVNALANADTNLTATNLEALGLDDDMNTSNTEQMKLLNNILPDGNNSAANVENIAKAVKAMFDTPITTTVDNFNDLGISDVNSSNLASINELIENTTPRPTTKEEIQAIVNALNKLRTAPTSNPSLTKDDLEKLNISDMNTTDELKLINSVLTNISNEDTNTTAKLQAIANAVQNVMNSSNGTTPDVNATQLATLGITDVNVTNIAGIVDALKNANPKPTTKEEIQTLVNNYNAVQALANGGNTDVNTTQLANLGINSATSANEAIYNSFLSSTDINTSDVNTTSKLQTVVDAVNALASNTDLNDSTLTALGLNDDINTSDANAMNLLNDILPTTDGNNSAANVETIAKASTMIQALANGDYTLPLTTTSTPTRQELIDAASSLGLTVTDGSLNAFANAVKEAGKAGANSLSKLQAFADNTAPTVGSLTLSLPQSVGANSNTINVSWTKASDNISVVSSLTYKVFNHTANTNMELLGSEQNGTDINSTSYTGLDYLTPYYVLVKVSDEAGNNSNYTIATITTGRYSATDADNDGVDDTTTDTSKDTDGDGIPDMIDKDIDGDGTPNSAENVDADGDGVMDYLDIVDNRNEQYTKDITAALSVENFIGTNKYTSQIVNDLNFTAPSVTAPTGLAGTTEINWTVTTSTDGNVTIGTLTNNKGTGTVARGSEDATLTLKATVSRQTYKLSKTFMITVLKDMSSESNATIAAKAKALLSWDMIKNTNELQSEVMTNLTLPTTMVDGVTVSWASNNSAIATNGTVTQDSSNVTGNITATITKGDKTETKTFDVTVLGSMTDEQKAKYDLENVDAQDLLGATGSVNEVDSDLDFTALKNLVSGVTPTITTTPAGIIAADGTITRPATDTEVTVKVTYIVNGETITKTFIYTVLGKNNHAEAIIVDGTPENNISSSGEYVVKYAVDTTGNYDYKETPANPTIRFIPEDAQVIFNPNENGDQVSVLDDSTSSSIKKVTTTISSKGIVENISEIKDGDKTVQSLLRSEKLGTVLKRNNDGSVDVNSTVGTSSLVTIGTNTNGESIHTWKKSVNAKTISAVSKLKGSSVVLSSKDKLTTKSAKLGGKQAIVTTASDGETTITFEENGASIDDIITVTPSDKEISEDLNVTVENNGGTLNIKVIVPLTSGQSIEL